MKALVVSDTVGGTKEIQECLHYFGIISTCVTSLKEAASLEFENDIILMGGHVESPVCYSDACNLNVIRFFIETARTPVIVIADEREEKCLREGLCGETKRVTFVQKKEWARQLHTVLRRLAQNVQKVE